MWDFLLPLAGGSLQCAVVGKNEAPGARGRGPSCGTCTGGVASGFASVAWVRHTCLLGLLGAASEPAPVRF